MKKYNTYLCLALSLCLVSCAASKPKKVAKKPLEYFSEKEYGVKASPRVVDITNSITSKRVAMPRGGGRDMVGKPYKVRGKWYYPREEIGYTATGKASWYGDAFHGRLTANGEVYDMNHLSGAHPTMPLPSYARVTNVKNGKSVIVRINDRGPYSHKRLVDLSKRAAEFLDYTRAGTATVKMEYVGRAPIEGRDDAYLMASYRENHVDASPVMVAQNDANIMSPQADLSYSEMQPLEKLAFSNEDQTVPFSVHSETPLPSRVPLPVVRPDVDIPINGYAPIESSAKTDVFAQFIDEEESLSERILLGVYDSSKLEAVEKEISSLAKIDYDKTDPSHIVIYVTPLGDVSIDNLISQLWSKGYSDAFIVR